MNKYVNYINDELTFETLNNIKKDLKNLNIFSLKKIEALKINSDNLFKIKIENKIFNIFYTDLKDSGKDGNNNKRIIISKSKSIIEKDKEFVQPILFYYSKNKICYIKFHSNGDFIWNDKIKNRSIWVSFLDIYACLKYSLNIKTKKYLISQNLKDIMINNNKFKIISKNEYDYFKKEIEKFEKNKFKIPNNLFNLQSNNTKYNDENIGRLTEELIFKLFKTQNTKLFEKKFNTKINSFYWNNQKEESYLPYDFLINDTIYLEVKGTIKNSFNFILSDNEWNFKNEKNKNYFLINIRWENVDNLMYSMKLYDFYELNKCKIIETIKYILKDERKE